MFLPCNSGMQIDCSQIHPSWQPWLQQALATMDPAYLQSLAHTSWLPGPTSLFNAFSLPVEQTRYVLLGESPYPRAASANGYAFWDGAVDELWSEKGFSKAVNRATSLRNWLKMLLLIDGKLKGNDLTQEAIAAIPKTHLVQTLPALFERLLQRGFLLLNASLVLSDKPVKQDAKAWRPFILHVLKQLAKTQPVTLILWGNIAQQIGDVPELLGIKRQVAEHPYNISFIHNADVQDFFRPMHLLIA